MRTFLKYRMEISDKKMEGAITMASIGGVSSSNTVSSLMNSANMISGLASGLDTEGMIENLVKS